MLTATTIAEVRAHVSRWRAAGERVVFVPTMGNLHAGHVSLIEAARAHGKRVVASIFVNPMQFGPNEDFAHYPRTPDAGRDDAERGGLRSDVHARGRRDLSERRRPTRRASRCPGISNILCGEFRPGHFEGVATVVAKLFHIVEPDVAMFGEKDFQQLTVIRRMVADLCLRVEIVGAPTVREADGLAMSSRNQYLDESQRGSRRLSTGSCSRRWRRLQSGARDFARIEGTGRAALDGAGFRTDYFSVRDARTLAPAQPDTRHFVVLTAARSARRGSSTTCSVQAGNRPARRSAVRSTARGSRCLGHDCPSTATSDRCSGAPVLAHQRRGSSRRASSAARDCRGVEPAHCPAPPRYCAASARSRCGGSPSLRCAPGIPASLHANSSAQPRGIEPVPRLEIRMRGGARELVPRAHELAVVAAVDAVAQHAAQFHRNRAVQLDGEIGNAAPRIELIGRGDRAGGTGGNAGRAGAAVRAGGLVHRQRQVGEDLADEEIRAGVARDQVGVLADPAEAGVARQRLLQHRARSRRTRGNPSAPMRSTMSSASPCSALRSTL